MQEPAEQTVVAGISPTAQIYLGSTATPWHFLPPGTCTRLGVGEGLGATSP